MHRFCRALVLLAPILHSVFAAQAPADIAIVNGRIFTGVPSAPWVEALHISADRITLAGTNPDVRAKAQPSTHVIDAGGRLVIPGINDAHVHLNAAPAHTRLDGPPAMQQDPTWSDVLERVKTAVAKTPGGG